MSNFCCCCFFFKLIFCFLRTTGVRYQLHNSGFVAYKILVCSKLKNVACRYVYLVCRRKVLKSTQIRLKTFYPQLVYNIICLCLIFFFCFALFSFFFFIWSLFVYLIYHPHGSSFRININHIFICPKPFCIIQHKSCTICIIYRKN